MPDQRKLYRSVLLALMILIGLFAALILLVELYRWRAETGSGTMRAY